MVQLIILQLCMELVATVAVDQPLRVGTVVMVKVKVTNIKVPRPVTLVVAVVITEVQEVAEGAVREAEDRLTYSTLQITIIRTVTPIARMNAMGENHDTLIQVHVAWEVTTTNLFIPLKTGE